MKIDWPIPNSVDVYHSFEGSVLMNSLARASRLIDLRSRLLALVIRFLAWARVKTRDIGLFTLLIIWYRSCTDLSWLEDMTILLYTWTSDGNETSTYDALSERANDLSRELLVQLTCVKRTRGTLNINTNMAPYSSSESWLHAMIYSKRRLLHKIYIVLLYLQIAWAYRLYYQLLKTLPCSYQLVLNLYHIIINSC